MAIRIKTDEEIKILSECGKRLGKILIKVKDAALPGVSTLDLNRAAEKLMYDAGGIPVFKGYALPDARPFPAAICTSVNDEVVHGIPRADVLLEEGDILGIDIGMAWPRKETPEYAGYHGAPLITDTALTVGVGAISEDAARLIRDTEQALFAGIEEIKIGKRIGDISARIEAFLRSRGLGIVRGLAGHGVGYEIHEDPIIPNYGVKGTGAVIREGMVIAIEPMATLGKEETYLDTDGWTFRTKDRSLAAHFEHTIAVGADGASIITVV